MHKEVFMPRVAHFEIYADDPERAVKFYTGVFGWQVKKWEGPMDYWLVMTGKDEPGIDGGIVKRQQPRTGKDGLIAYLCTVGVDSVDTFLEKVTAQGGTVVQPKTPVPGVGWLARCMDTEGNIFGLMQDDPLAK
jgi:predicted enzyme related to lactoylglutathione lyase